MYTIIKATDIYRERIEPAWEYPDANDQWLFAETIREYVRTEYDVLYVYEDGTYKERRGMRMVPASAEKISRNDVGYDETKRRLKRRWF